MAKEESRSDIEFSIQDLMYHAVVANRKSVGAIEGGVNKVKVVITQSVVSHNTY